MLPRGDGALRNPSAHFLRSSSSQPSSLTRVNIMAVTQLLTHPVLALFGVYALYLLGLVIYRLCFHPLAKFPGPRYAAISRWHEFYYEVVLKGQFTFKVQELHNQYGRC